MILIITHKLDFTVDFVVDQLNKQQLPYLRLNCEDLLNSPMYHLGSSDGLEIRFKDLPKVTSVWFRRTQVPDLPELSMQERAYFYREFDALLDNIAISFDDVKWLSVPFEVRKAENKIGQLKAAKKLGFNIPETLVTNDKECLRKFFKNREVSIVKPLYSGKVPVEDEGNIFFTSKITQEVMDNLDGFDLTPCLYQEYIEKQYELRITVVDHEVFAVKIDSQNGEDTKTDWRKGNPVLKIYDLPEDISRRCLELCKQLRISFGAIDMIRSVNGDYVFLEINPNGQWAWIELETGLPISKAIINYLKDE